MYVDIDKNNKLIQSFQVGKVSGQAGSDSAGVQCSLVIVYFKSETFLEKK